MSSESRVRKLRQWDGARNGWRASLPLRPEEESVIVDCTALRATAPTFLLRLRAFAEWHLHRGHTVRIIVPTNRAVATHMARMGVDSGLPEETFIGLPKLEPGKGSAVLIPITQLQEFPDVDELGERLFDLFVAHSDDVAVFADAMQMAAGELCGNAVEHGANELGCYVAAQRYERPHRHTVLALGDLGIGIPAHLRKRFPGLRGDRSALREAVKEGVTATGKSERGIGFTSVIEGARGPKMRYATLDIHSGRAQLLHQVSAEPEAEAVTTTADAPNKIGTWATFELGPVTSV
jgi:hypothetical protein